MFLFKTSGKTLGSVIANQKHAFRGRPRDWDRGELVLVSKNRLDCSPGEKQIQYIMRLEEIRPLASGEAERYWPGMEDRWRYLVICSHTQRLIRPFDLHEALGTGAHAFGPVMTFKRFERQDERRVLDFMRSHNLGLSL
jgi:hypothetical protein